jgi:replicative DNA helicase
MSALAMSADVMMKAPIFLDDSGGLDILELRARARRMKKQYGIQLFIVDYLQLLGSKHDKVDGRQHETAGISRSIKGTPRSLGARPRAQPAQLPETHREGKPRLPTCATRLDRAGRRRRHALRRPSRYDDPGEATTDPSPAIVNIASSATGRRDR